MRLFTCFKLLAGQRPSTCDARRLYRPPIPALRTIALMAALAVPTTAPQAEPPPESGRLPPGVVPLAYTLMLDIDPRKDRFSGEATIRVELQSTTSAFWIHGKDLRVAHVALRHDQGGEIDATYEESTDQPGWARITLAQPASAGQANLVIRYDAAFAVNASGLYRTELAGDHYAATHFEPINARRAFPGFDEPRFKTPFEVTIVAPEGDVVIANMPEDRSEPAGAGKTRHVFLRSQPLPSYLVAFAVGPFDVVEAEALPPSSVRSWPVGLRGAAPKGKGPKLALALQKTWPILAWLEEYFATPYPYPKLDIVAVPERPGAMENAAAIFYNERLLLLDADAPITQLRWFGEVHAHEIAHQWFGNLVTPAWWDDLWLKEAFAIWISVKAVNAVMPELGLEHETELIAQQTIATDDSLSASRRIREPIKREADIGDAYDNITYLKGGGVLAMAESYLGEEAFRDGVRLYLKRFPFGVATARDFFESLALGSSKAEIVPALESFTGYANAPLLSARLACSPDTAPRVMLMQGTYKPLSIDLPGRTWTLPICLSDYRQGQKSRKVCTMLDAPQGAVELSGACPALIVPNADGAGYYVFDLDEDGWDRLIRDFAVLSDAEQIAALYSANASFRAGKVDPRTLTAIVEAGAKSRSADARRTSIAVALNLEAAIPDAGLNAYQAWVRRVWDQPESEASVSENAGGTERALAKDLTKLVALKGKSPARRAQLLAGALATLGLGQSAREVAPDVREIALVVAVEDGGSEAFSKLLEQTKASTDGQFQREALIALANAPRPEDQQAFIEAVNAGAFSPTEAANTLMWRLGEYRGARAFAWTAGKATFAWLAERIPQMARQAMPFLASGLCSAAGQAELKAFFAANGAKVPGHERSLTQTDELIGRCAALRDARGAELATVLAAARN